MTDLQTYRDLVMIEPGRRGGRPCLRGTRIAVADVLRRFAAGLSGQDIADDFPEVTDAHVRACLACAADRERRL